MSLISPSGFPHLKFVIQIPGLSKLRHFHSVKQQPTGARTTLSFVIFRFLAEYSDSSNNVNGIIVISINLLVVYRESVNLIGFITRRLSADSLQL